jgi:methionyl-tRNA formyltransferase
MIPMEVLTLAPRGALNLHGSKLPRLRGRAPINWALVECEEESGVTLHHMVKAPDAGDIVAQRAWKIGARDTAKDLFFRAVDEAKLLLRDFWPAVRDGKAPRIPQDSKKATYRGRRRPDDGRIDWSQPTKRVDGLVRAVTDPFPGAFTTVQGRKIMVWQGVPSEGKGSPGTLIEESLVATGDGAYRIERCDYADGAPDRPVLRKGMKLGD